MDINKKTCYRLSECNHVKKVTLFIFFVLSSFFCVTYAKKRPSAVTYEFEEGSRLGDHLMLYGKTKWMAYTYKMRLLYKPFKFSQQLAMHTKEKLYTPALEKKFARTIHLCKFATEPIRPNDNTLYVIHRKFIDAGAWTYSFGDMADTFKKNPAFLGELKAMLSPISIIQTITIPPNMLSIAVHIRRGGGFDRPLYQSTPQPGLPAEQFADKVWPAKFPPHNFYIEQINRIAQVYNGVPLYIHIFTDDPNPENIVNMYKKDLAGLPITFGYRRTGNMHTRNVLEDLFSMSNFDFLIRPASGLSLFSQILGNHKLVIYPLHTTWQNDTTLVVDKVGFSGPLASGQQKEPFLIPKGK